VKIGNSERNLVKLDEIEWCSILKNINQSSKTNRYFKPIIKDLKECYPRLFEPCPFIGELKLINVPPGERMASILPTGMYKTMVRIKDKKENCFVNIEYHFTRFH
jgi:hypothetical protein